MTPDELYKREPESVEHYLHSLSGCYYSHVPEVDTAKLPIDDPNGRVEIVVFKDFDFDGRRYWRLAAVRFDGDFVMIMQNAGREGDDHARRFITNKEAYGKLVGYLASLSTAEANDDDDDVVDPEKELEGLTSFYGHFERYRY